ncbi:phage tail tape measure protein [Sphingobacterium sp. MYb388]|uniref:phage tail tape measure protein n=1 Tax=Sphingobacterium sp. MYb388 TaxID=2745437 RepID=UPI0030A7034B
MAKKLSEEDLVLNIIVNGNKAQSDIGKVSRTLVDAKANLKAAQSEMKELEKQGKTNSARYQTLTTDIGKYNAAITESKKKLAELNQSLKLNELSEKQLEAALKRNINLRKQSVPGSDSYKAYSAQIDQVRNRLIELRAGADNTGNSLMRMGNRLNQYIGTIVAGGASLIAMWSGVKKATNEFAHFDDVLADVQKTTNLTKNGVKDLNTELAKIETRTSQEDLLGLGRIAGKLGYTDIKDITEFVRANNQIIVSLNEDLGGNVEETVNKIGKLVDIFKLKDLYSTEEAFLKVGSSINELGMASTANEGYMVEFARRMAGVAPLAGITIDQILGLGATLDQLGQSEEVSSTSLSKMFLSMAKNAEVYSKYAGMQITDFKNLLEKDFMAAFTKVLSGVKDNAAGMTELAATLGDLGEDGGRTIGVLGSLANNVDVLKASMDLASVSMQEGTSISAEYAIKNQTAVAKLEMAQKQVKAFWIELGEKLMPVMTSTNSILGFFLKTLTTLVTFISSNFRAISSLTIAVVAYYTAVQIAAKWEAISSGLLAAKRVLLAGVTIVQGLLTGAITRTAAAQQLLNLRMLANPYGLVAAALAGLIAYMVIGRDKINALTEAQNKLASAAENAKIETSGETSAIDTNLKAVLNSKTAIEQKKLAIEKLRQIMPDVLKDYTDEEIMAGKATTAIKAQSEAIVLRAQARLQEEMILEGMRKREQVTQKLNQGFSGLGTMEQLGYYAQGFLSFQRPMELFLNDIRDGYEDADASVKTYQQGLMDTMKTLATLQLKIASSSIQPDGTKVGTDTSKEDAKAARAVEAASKKARLKELDDAKINYQEKLKAEGLFQKDINSLTAEQLEKRAQIKDDYIKKENEINAKYNHSQREQTNKDSAELDRRAANERRYRDKLVDKTDPLIQQEKEAYEKRLEQAGLFDKEMEDKIKKRDSLSVEQKTALEILQKNHQKNLNKIDADAIAKHTDKVLKANADELADLKIKHIDELSSITTLAQAKEALAGKLSDKELRSVTSFNEARKLLQNQQDLEEQNLKKAHLEELLKILQATLESGQMEGVDLNNIALTEEKKEVLKKSILEVKEILATLTTAEKKKDIEKVDILGMSSDDWKTLFDNLAKGKIDIEGLLGLMGAMTQVWSQYNSFVAAGENRKLQDDEQANKKKKSNLDARLKSGTISQESYNKQVEKLDKDLDKKKSEVAHNQAKRDRNVALMSAIVNTATAVTKILTLGLIGMILAPIVGAMGALQVGTILKTPLPAIEGREDGGYLDVTRSQDGKQFRAKNRPNQRGFVNEPTVIVGENGKEWVASASTVNNPFAAPIISLLDTMQSNGRIDPAVLSNIITSTMPGRVNGGYLNNNSSRSSTATRGQTTIVNESDEEIRKLIANNTAVTNALYQAVKNGVSVSLLGPEGFKAKMAELDRIQNNADL